MPAGEFRPANRRMGSIFLIVDRARFHRVQLAIRRVRASGRNPRQIARFSSVNRGGCWFDEHTGYLPHICAVNISANRASFLRSPFQFRSSTPTFDRIDRFVRK